MISDRTALTPQGVRNVLDALVESEAVTMVGAGRSRLYRIRSWWLFGRCSRLKRTSTLS
jgi:uncharacterized HAD superfamily protein